MSWLRWNQPCQIWATRKAGKPIVRTVHSGLWTLLRNAAVDMSLCVIIQAPKPVIPDIALLPYGPPPSAKPLTESPSLPSLPSFPFAYCNTADRVACLRDSLWLESSHQRTHLPDPSALSPVSRLTPPQAFATFG